MEKDNTRLYEAMTSAKFHSEMPFNKDKLLNLYFSKELNQYHMILEEKEHIIPMPANDMVLIAQFVNGKQI